MKKIERLQNHGSKLNLTGARLNPTQIILSAFFPTTTPLVPILDAQIFESKLRAKIIIEHGKGHFSGSSGIKELPSALESVLGVARKNQ